LGEGRAKDDGWKLSKFTFFIQKFGFTTAI